MNKNRFIFISVIGLVLIALLGFGCVSAVKNSEREVTAFVESKERVCSSNSDCKYLVYTDEGTFEITDSVIYGRFSSSDTYGRINEDKTYQFKVAGWRFPLLSSYPNIISEPFEVTQ